MNYWFANLVPEKWRWAHRWYAWWGFYYWGPCNTCDRIFGGHEWRDIDGKVSSIPDPKRPEGSGGRVGICPACTRAGRGVDTLLAAPALPEEQPMEKCANCGMPIVPCEIGYTHMPDGWMVECNDASPTRTVVAEDAWKVEYLRRATKVLASEHYEHGFRAAEVVVDGRDELIYSTLTWENGADVSVTIKGDCPCGVKVQACAEGDAEVADFLRKITEETP